MKVEELVPMPEPEPLGMDFDKGWDGIRAYGHTDDAMRTYGQQIAAAVAKRCADLCQQSDEDGEGPDCWGWHSKDYADAIRREFGEVSK